MQSGVYLQVVDRSSRAARIVDMGVSAPLATIPRGRVVDLVGSDLLSFEATADPSPDHSPVAVSVVIDRPMSLARTVDDVVRALAAAVVDLFPTWLLDDESPDPPGYLDPATATRLVRLVASRSGHSMPALTVLTQAGRSGRLRLGELAPETLARECALLLATTYRRTHVCLAVTRADPAPDDADPVPDAWTLDDQRVVATACEWLTRHADVAVCLVGDPLPAIDRFTPVPWATPSADAARAVETVDADDTMGTGVSVRLPAVSGRPHPASVAEQRLHAYLAQHVWSSGARWNEAFAPDPLAAPIRVDIVWPHARCVVEIDGDDHRSVAKYAADRRRDNMLQLAGYTVYRFTNREVLDDVSLVADVIERGLRGRIGAAASAMTAAHPNGEAHHR
ncbi:endonuclease domain-containing protein [Williamsia maris]|uniref:DUF559 domain-containing protein n=1 Tax=Williamsia maris TaxID=72806 RepID=A0ABT1HH64_9NOCA|nr:DUF559 domain-containing protein [Williamsia maris]MCP2177578.1 Protein of unknown function (DUF559) [Williamsia maris]